MEKVKSRKFFICVLALVIAYTFILVDAVRFTKYNYHGGYQCVPKDTLFQSDNVLDAITCGKLCYQIKKCLSFSYQPDDKRCIGCEVEIFGAFAARSQTVPWSMYFSTDFLEADCSDIKTRNPNATSGVYKIQLWKSKSVIDVYCDMATEDYGWTVFQNRFDGSVNFYRDCEDYENGFGSLTGEFWLGLKYIQEIASKMTSNVLRIVLSRENGDNGTETLHGFYLVEGSNYSLSWRSIYRINMNSDTGFERVPQSMSYAMVPFSCKDRDRDEMVAHCAADRHGAWWHRHCSEVNLNGDYCTPGQVCDDGNKGKTGFYHKAFAGYESLKTSKIMIRPEL